MYPYDNMLPTFDPETACHAILVIPKRTRRDLLQMALWRRLPRNCFFIIKQFAPVATADTEKVKIPQVAAKFLAFF
jgi:hypothetical protein